MMMTHYDSSNDLKRRYYLSFSCDSFYIFNINDTILDLISSYRSGRRRKCTRCSLGTHCPKYRGPGRRTPHLDSRNFPRPGPGNRNSDRTRTFLVCSCNNIKQIILVITFHLNSVEYETIKIKYFFRSAIFKTVYLSR